MKDHLLTGPKPSHRIRLRRGDWLVTDGTVVGRFDKTQQLDWLPLEWVKGTPVILDETVGPVVDSMTVKIPISKLVKNFEDLLFVEPGELTPEMPLPPLGQLGSYLKARRILTAYTYDCR